MDWEHVPVPEGVTAVSAFETASKLYTDSEFEGAAKGFLICLQLAKETEDQVLQARATANLSFTFQVIGHPM